MHSFRLQKFVCKHIVASRDFSEEEIRYNAYRVGATGAAQRAGHPTRVQWPIK